MKSIGIIGGGIFGLYIAAQLLKEGYKVDLFEQSPELGTAASRVNQARLHLGFHYPRSIETASACINGFIKFQSKFPKAINNLFYKYYAISKENSKVSADEYIKFCNTLGLEYKIVNLDKQILNNDLVDLTIEVAEVSFDWKIIIEILEKEILKLGGCIYKNHKVVGGNIYSKVKELKILNKKNEIVKNYDIVINATYANINNILKIFSLPEEKLEFELCEMSLVKVPKKFNNLGVTIMDGDFTSVMPFGLSGYQTISNVKYTPHAVSKTSPNFNCYASDDFGSYLENVNDSSLPYTNFYKMKEFAQNYLPYVKDIELVEPMFTIKTILQNQDCTDARPTLIFEYKEAQSFYTIFSGKVDTVIDITNELIKKIKDS